MAWLIEIWGGGALTVCCKPGAKLCRLPTLAEAAALPFRAAVFGVSGKGRARGVAAVACDDTAGMVEFDRGTRLTGDCDAVVVVDDAADVAVLVRELTGPAFLNGSLVMKGWDTA
ncbi:hypothetical protein KCV06_g198, partial [Aureobasidium melanogenum]